MEITVTSVIKEIDQILAAEKDFCSTRLKPLILMPKKPDQAYACLELFHTQNYELVYNEFFVRHGKIEVNYAALPGFAGEQSFIPKLDRYLKLIALNLKWSVTEGQSFTDLHEKQFQAWFKEIWVKAEGPQALVPTFFCFEKEYRVQDILTGEVMEEDAAAEGLGFFLK